MATLSARLEHDAVLGRDPTELVLVVADSHGRLNRDLRIGVACREEEVPEAGDYLEYTIGDQSILVVRTDPGNIKGYFNTCLHRGTRLADGRGIVML